MDHMVQRGNQVLEAPDPLLQAGRFALEVRVLAQQRRNSAALVCESGVVPVPAT